jgi:hypothetical protein
MSEYSYKRLVTEGGIGGGVSSEENRIRVHRKAYPLSK